jgi:hypothetical protein
LVSVDFSLYIGVASEALQFFFPGDREGVILFVCLSVYVRLIKDVLFFGFSGWNNLKEPIGNFLNMSKLMRGYF